MATDFGGAQPPYQRIEEVEDIDNPEKWFDTLDRDTEFAHYENEREQRLKRTELLRNSVIVRNIRQPDQLCKELQEVLKGDTIVVGVADEEDIRERDRKEAAKKFNERQEDAERFQQQAAEYQKLERLARQRLMDQLATKQKELQAKADDAAVRDQERQEHLNKMLRAAEYKLQATLRSRKGELKTTYGSLDTDSAYTEFATTQVVNPQPLNKRAQFIGKKYQVDWTKAPQPLRIRLDLCRAAKDKLPQGQYVMMTSVWNRLGGHRLQWSCLQNLEDRDLDAKKGKSMFKQVTELLDDKAKAKELTGIISTCSSVSAPVAHAGLWYSDVLRFDQAVYMACPAEKDMTPSMCLVFELYLLRGSVSPVDKLMVGSHMPLFSKFNGSTYDSAVVRVPGRRGVEGKENVFKIVIPMIRGAVDTSIDRYALYESRYRDDIQAWLCNFYFRCDRLPKYSAGQLEYEVQLSYTGKILGLKKHKNVAEDKTEGRKESRKKADAAVAHLSNTLKDDGMFGKLCPDDVRKHFLQSIEHDPAKPSENETVEATKDGIRAWKHMGEGNDVYRPLMNPEDFNHYQFSGEKFLFHSDLSPAFPQDEVIMRLANTHSIRKHCYAFLVDPVKMLESLCIVSGGTRRQERVPEHLSYTYLRVLCADSPFEVTSGHTLVISSEFERKKKYICDELFGDYTLSSDIKELGLCGFALIILLLAFWVRIYIHYFGQWLMLSAFRVPIYQFDVSFVTVKVGYVQALLTSDQEAAVVASGPGMSYLVFLFMMCVVVLFQKFVGTVPSIVYRFLPSFGLATIFDPELILIIDAANGHMTGDAFKLYNYFQTKDHNGIIGIVSTCLIYAIFTAIALVTFYQYITKVHRHGRIRDTHRRLTADEPEFFVPLDNEVSLRYLKWVCYKAKLFKGENGHTRRVQVTEFIVDQESQTAVKRMAQLGDIAAGNSMEEEDLENLQLGLDDKSLVSRIFRKKRTTTTTYVCIHTLDPANMSRTLYRHFMRYPSGAIVELSPKEPAQMNTTGRPPPTKVEEITYDETTHEQTRRAEVPIGDWMKENFDSRPPALAAGSQGARNSIRHTVSQQQEHQRAEEGPRSLKEGENASGVVEQANTLHEDNIVGRRSASSVNALERVKGQEPKGILKQKREAGEEEGELHNSTGAAAAVEVSQHRPSSAVASTVDVRPTTTHGEGVEERNQEYEKEASVTNYGQANVDAAFEQQEGEEHVELAAADYDQVYASEADEEEQKETPDDNEEVNEDQTLAEEEK